MSLKEECFYCSKDHRLHDLMLEVCQLQVSTVYLNKDQTHDGRCIVTFKQHKTELFQLEKEKLHLFMEDVARVAEAIKKAFRADKINYAIYGDLVSHVHFHLVPKYRGGDCWGEAFENSPQTQKTLQEEEYSDRLNLIRSYL